MIRSVRRILLSLLSSQMTTDEVLLTPMCEVERILNDRPLTMVSKDPNDLVALTPNHLLLLKGAPTSMPVEYLPELQRRYKWHKERNEMKVEKGTPRGKWPKGLIEEVIPGKD